MDFAGYVEQMCKDIYNFKKQQRILRNADHKEYNQLAFTTKRKYRREAVLILK
jgi:hypothetical protein